MIGSNAPDSLIVYANFAFEVSSREGWAFEDTPFFVAKQTGTDTIDSLWSGKSVYRPASRGRIYGLWVQR